MSFHSICGVISEYDPFHLGHARHLAETRRRLGGDTLLVCALSGSFLQRGSAAVFDKSARAEAALRCGADLVLELPLPWSMAPAERFAAGGVSLLARCGCTHLSFGCESGDATRLRSIAALLLNPDLNAPLREGLAAGLAYAEARQRAAEALAGEALPELRRSNDILGIEYCKALARLETEMEPVAVLRRGAAHDSPGENEYPSAAWLRRLLAEGKPVNAYTPPEAAAVWAREAALGRAPLDMERLDTALSARLRGLSPEGFRGVPDLSEGLEHRLSAAAAEAGSLEEMVRLAGSRRYPAARLRRCLTAAALGLRTEDGAGAPPYLRVLAADARGRELLRTLRDRGEAVVSLRRDLPETDAARRCWALESAASDLRALACPGQSARRGGVELRRKPVML